MDTVKVEARTSKKYQPRHVVRVSPIVPVNAWPFEIINTSLWSKPGPKKAVDKIPSQPNAKFATVLSPTAPWPFRDIFQR